MRPPLEKDGSIEESGALGRPALSLSALVGSLRERFLYRVATLGFDLIILMFMTLLLIASVLALGGHIRVFQATALLPLIYMVAVITIKVWRDPSSACWRHDVLYVIRDWVPFFLVVFIYENLHDVAGQVTSFDIAGTLNNWDIAIFGVEPTIWAQTIHSPWLTDLMSISYAMWFFQPLFIMFLLSLWGMRAEFRHIALCLALVFILGFLGYVFLPCSPPRYFIEHLYVDPVRLHGIFLFNGLQGAWDNLSVISGGAFPSLHVGSSTVALIYAYKYRNLNRTCRIVWYLFIPLVTSLWFSTIYLRHHWVIDIIAGWGVALLAYAGASLMVRAWRGLRERYGLPF